MRKCRNKKLIIAIIAVVLTLLTSTGVTLAYFSDYETAMGEVTLNLNGQTEIYEEVTDTQKVIRIFNTGDANVVVRVAVYGPEGMKVTADDEHWQKHGGYYYYDMVLKAGESTGTITADITGIPVTEDLSEFDIIVNHESAIAVYDEENTVKKPDGWDYIPMIKAK